MKKFIFLLAIVMIAFAVLSCNNSENPPNITATDEAATDEPDTNSEAAVVELIDGLGEWDFDGYEFKNISRGSGMFADYEEETGEVLNDAIYNRNKRIEERFNITFVETVMPSSDMATSMRRSLMAHDGAYDTMVIRSPDSYPLAQEGYLRPFTDLPHLDFSKPYWDEWLTSQYSITNKIFFAAGAYDLNMFRASALLFNKLLAQNLGAEDLYALVTNGKWTFDKFEEMGKLAANDLDGDGVMTIADQFGYVGGLKVILPAFWIAGGVKTIEKDKDDIPYLSALEPEFINVWFKMADVLLHSGVWCDKLPDLTGMNVGDPATVQMFSDGRSLFYAGEVGHARNLREMEIDFGIIPYPKLDENQDKYYSQLPWAELLSIPIYAADNDVERTSVIIEALACDSYKTVTPVYYEIVLKTKFSRDEESEAMVDLIFANRIFDWGDTTWCPLLRDGIFINIFHTKSDTIVSAVEAKQANIQATIDKMVEAFLALD